MDKLYGIDTEYFIGNNMKDIIVLGGGTAGWITALLTKHYYPGAKITLVESEEIGILGAGEGTTPHIITLLDKIKIPYSDLVKNCKSTIKHGINFVNWNGDGKSFFHSFGVSEQLDEFTNFISHKLLSESLKVNSSSFSRKLTDTNKVGFTYKNNFRTAYDNPLGSFQQIAGWACHFDARELARFLRKVAESRDIKRIDGKLKSFGSDDNGNITKINLEDGTTLAVDFIFDCSGFSRLILGKHFNTEWKSYSDHLPMNKAVPFFIEHDGDTSPQTDAIAMKYGWIWRIPVEGRYGCGYVFDSSYIDEEKALKEASDYFDKPLTSPKTFSFSPGTFKETLVKNCMAVGLAQSFVEPLEATSIWISYLNLDDFLQCNGIFLFEKDFFQKTFNRRCYERNDEVLEFLYLHYLTKRDDSEFWKEFREKNPMLDIVKHRIEMINHGLDPESKYFVKKSWYEVCDGLGLIQPDYFQNLFEHVDKDMVEMNRKSLNRNQKNMLKACLAHKDFLYYLKNF
jgi:tryptophan halogenase